MAFEIVKVTNCGIKLTTGTIIPVIRVIVRGDPADTDPTTFYTAVQSMAKGFVSVATVIGADSQYGITVPAASYGDNTGFSLSVTKVGDNVDNQQLWYKGPQLVSCAKIYSGSTNNETTYLTIITDEDGNIYKAPVGFSSYLGFSIANTANPGITARKNMYTVAIVTDSPLHFNNVSRVPTIPVGESISNLIVNEISTDPFEPAGESKPDGWGDGDFDFSSTDIPIPTLPTIGAQDTGFSTLYAPSAAQLKSLASYLWAGSFDIDNLRKLVANPMDVIMGLYIIPTAGGHPTSASSQLVVGNISTGLTMPKVSEQYFEVDCGTIAVKNKWGSYLDYFPYSKLSLYLPYIGFVPLNANDCMGGSIKVVYHVDVVSGTCVAFVYCVSNRNRDGHTLYTFEGSCSTICPVTSGQYASVFDMISNAASAATSLAMSNPRALTEVKNAIHNSVAPEVTRSGEFGGSGGLMSIQYPFLILTVPNMAIPGFQNTYIGYPSFITKQMSDLMGYTEVLVTHLNGMSATSEEITEIITLLSEGVIF